MDACSAHALVGGVGGLRAAHLFLYCVSADLVELSSWVLRRSPEDCGRIEPAPPLLDPLLKFGVLACRTGASDRTDCDCK